MNDEYLNPQRDIHHSCKLPGDLDTPVWRYMDWWKFESLVKNSAIYLRRVDLLEDVYEAAHSSRQLDEMDTWLNSIEYSHLITTEQQSRAQFRGSTYVTVGAYMTLILISCGRRIPRA